ncbi:MULTISPECIES: universal stress protein [Edwardsiella]|uniref:Universal stress protein n=2 Tax=Edwardsiella anguillarum TaxID=1821960 RepID=A0A076LND4_9GAMM|nr:MULTISPECIES: universal stress protein [Edwardsiella]AKM47957.1 universal stress protein F [Edwardsiella sp. EA181011]GAJ68764.1 universal stress protein F [Edwardsiella piscicida]AIJ10015.1 universal stress protein family, putative [Edwardsiella anguillarum ET080813]AKR77651.1 universal stress protein [Edwardsiella sp. LADL05-105]KAB0589774.1 universal stress protein F [Edwardsiella anguillarum]
MYKTILVPIDLTEDNMSRLVIPHVENFARQEDAHIHFLAVLPPLSSFYGMGSLPVGHYPSEKDRLQHAEAGLRQVAAQFNLPEDRVHCTIAIGAPRDRILLQAGEIGADLIIVASHRPDITTYLLGSTAASVVRHASTAVLVVR